MLALFGIIALGARISEDPIIVYRPKTEFVGIASTESAQTLGTVFSRSFPKLMAFVQQHHLQPVGAPFIQYKTVDMPKAYQIVVGFPVKQAQGDATVKAGSLPAGRYLMLAYYGNYSGLAAPNAAIQTYAHKKGWKFKMARGAKGEEFVSRFECYLTDPSKNPDPKTWKTEIYFLLDK